MAESSTAVTSLKPGDLILYDDPANGVVEAVVLDYPLKKSHSNEKFVRIGPSFSGCGQTRITVSLRTQKERIQKWTEEAVQRAKIEFVKKQMTVGVLDFEGELFLENRKQATMQQERQKYWDADWPDTQELGEEEEEGEGEDEEDEEEGEAEEDGEEGGEEEEEEKEEKEEEEREKEGKEEEGKEEEGGEEESPSHASESSDDIDVLLARTNQLLKEQRKAKQTKK